MFSRFLRHPTWKQRWPILIMALHKFVTSLLTYPFTYSPETYTGQSLQLSAGFTGKLTTASNNAVSPQYSSNRVSHRHWSTACCVHRLLHSTNTKLLQPELGPLTENRGNNWRFLQSRGPCCHPNNSVRALMRIWSTDHNTKIKGPRTGLTVIALFAIVPTSFDPRAWPSLDLNLGRGQGNARVHGLLRPTCIHDHKLLVSGSTQIKPSGFRWYQHFVNLPLTGGKIQKSGSENL